MNETRWLLEGWVPVGARITITDLDDPPLEELFAQGFDVVLRLHDRGDTRFRARRPIKFSVHWRDGLVPGDESPAPIWIRRAVQGGFERCEAA